MPVDVLEGPTLERRRYCECCGLPSLVVPPVDDTRLLDDERDDRGEWRAVGSPWWEYSASACELCEWESRPLDSRGNPSSTPEVECNEGLTLEQARANYARFGSIYDPNALPEWKVSAPSPSLQEARRALREAYEVLVAAEAGAQWEPWEAVVEAEWDVRDALATQQAADEERVAGDWDDAEETTG